MKISWSCRRPFWLSLVAVFSIGGFATVAGPAAAVPSVQEVITRSDKPELAAASVPLVDPALVAAAAPVANPTWLPVAAPMPNPSTQVALVDVGRIQIPRTGVDEIVREGIEQMVIDAGPAHWPGTASFGGWGNTVLAGHRSTKTAPFLRNGELVAGDLIVLSDVTGVYSYRVTKLEVVSDTALWITDQHPGRTLTIFTCHPIGSSRQRLIVSAELVTRPRTEV